MYAAAGRDALLNSSGNSRDRKRSRGGPGTAIVFYRITGRHTSHAIYTRQQAHADVHTQVHIQYTHNRAPPQTMSGVTTKPERWIVPL